MKIRDKIAAIGSLCAVAGIALIGASAPAAAQTSGCPYQAVQACKGAGYVVLGYSSFQHCYQWELFYCENGGGPGDPDPQNVLYFKD